ncbi:hypothetical protein TWF569_004318 [Orbilia oligospora]|uniref:Uncharacterized protein n=1 Tax=Orbilia oligospora TaxID=2813651 RepID=A0A7C8JA14_ORBOL|nr:hypothetical protein TWF103_005127 [Orbilia oligospora]KAF3098744.1 hypothetical protein TWF706_006749 [Orbilia oligospora]KAF3099452.1 hypothetical protein TWF102_005432 [Orbilia oligospora]KAF3119117.1 hypothetical protein TWF569_004318 [Orbilia oligospora]KAF3130002.1 hypothetical protein TWF594_010576 [Orbilia oligospora]
MSLFYGIYTALWQLVTSEGFPPKPGFEEKDVPDLSGKVYLITGATGGIGFELAKILYSKNAKVYIAGRSEENGTAAVNKIKEEYPKSDGGIEFLQLDLSDLTTIKPAADKLLSQERRLDAVVHNAGVMATPTSWRSAQGWELHFGTNVLGPFVLQRHLQNLLVETVKFAPKDSVRVLFLSSICAHVAPAGGINYENIENKGIPPLSYIPGADTYFKYAQSKCANTILAKGYAEKYKDTGIIAVSPNPGNLKTDLMRHSLPLKLFGWMFLYPARYGGLTELYATLSPEIDQSKNGSVIIPWGRVGPMRSDIVENCNSGGALKFWNWLEEHTEGF